MRLLLEKCLRRIAGASLADDILGDLHERRASTWSLLAILLSAAATRITDRKMRGISSSRVLSDLRYTLRSLRRAPWYSSTTIGVIAVAMALAMTVFAVVDGVLFKPLPYAKTAELYDIKGTWRARTDGGTSTASWSDFTAWQSALPGAAFAMTSIGDRASVSGDPARSASVSEGFFSVIGQPLLMGGFRAEDFAPASRSAARQVLPVILTYAYWQRQFAGDPAILGKVFTGDDGALSQVAGVTSPGFLFPYARTARFLPDVLTPLRRSANPENDRRGNLVVIARMSEHSSLAELNARVQTAQAAVARRFALPAGARGLGAFDTATVRTLDDVMRSYQRRTFTIVFATAAALLLLACLNVAGLAAARAEDRAGELTLRRALGGGGVDVARLLATESAVIVILGSVLGAFAAKFLLLGVSAYLPLTLVLLKPAALDIRVAGFCALAAAISIAITSAWPVRAVLRQTAMRGSGGGSRSTRQQGRLNRFVLIGTEVALAFVMAVGGALLIGSLIRVWREDPGFRVDRVMNVWIGMKSEPSFEEASALIDDLRRLPGVANAGGSTLFLLQNAVKGSSFDTPPGGNDDAAVESVGITNGFFATVELRPVSGRLPSDAELASGAAVAVVSERVARDYWHGEPAVGRALIRRGRPYAVIGVVREARTLSLDRDPEGVVYYPMAADPTPYLSSVFVACNQPSCSGVVTNIANVIDARHSKFRVRSAESMSAALGSSVRVRSFQAMLFGMFGASAVLIVGAGVLGLVAMVTSRRTREVGVRMALGATATQVASLIVRQELAAVAAGLVAGIVMSLWTTTLVRTYLYKISAYDMRLWSAAIILLLSTSAIGALIPALRASRIDPVKALRID